MNLNLQPTLPHASGRPSRRERPGRRFRLHPLALAMAALLTAPGAVQHAIAQTALPAGAQVVNGQASITTQGSRMTVTNSSNAILNWQSFSIGAGNSVRFDQPSASSQVLNRVLGNDPSAIFGQLSSNGRVWLLNPNGVLFGPNARVDVAGLVASTLNISDADWRAQRYNLLSRDWTEAGSDAAVVNQGELRSTLGGRVLLIGGPGGVRNEGLIDAPGGQVVLAAGRSVDLADSAMPDIAVRVSAPQGQVLNLGHIGAAGGRVDLMGAMVNQSGIVRADALVGVPGGRGGEIVLRAADTTLVSGTLSANADSGQGGSVQLLGPQVGLLDGAVVDTSGGRGGGSILVGGGVQGRDASIPNSRAVYFDGGASLTADATERGNGGSIVLWSDEATRAFGRLSARGGARGGDGGFIETSGGWLDARPASVRTDAAQGQAGRWLLDPNNLLISDTGPNTAISSGPNFTTTGNSAVLSTATIVAALNGGSNVSIATASAGANSQAGDITMSNAIISAAPPTPVTLTLTADQDISVFNSTIQSDGAPLSITMNAARSGIGAIFIGTASMITQGGNITLGGPSATFCGANSCVPNFTGAIGWEPDGSVPGVNLSGGASLNAGSGSVRITGAGSSGSGDVSYGVYLQSGASINAADVTIVGRADSNNTQQSIGVKVLGDINATRSINLDGSWDARGIGPSSQVSSGVYVAGNLSLLPSGSDPGASLQLKGAATGESSGWEVVSVYGSLLAGGQSSVRLIGDNGSISLGPTSFNTTGANLLSITGNAFLAVGSDMALPTGGSFNVNTLWGANFSSGTLSGNPVAVSINANAATLWIGAMTCGGSCPGSADLNFGNANVTMNAGLLEIGNAQVQSSISGGRVQLKADQIKIGPLTTGISASQGGDALLFAGRTGNTSQFLNYTGVNAVTAPNGRWLVYATDPTDQTNFNAGGLVRDFTQYGATYGLQAPIGSGDGMLFSVTPQALLTAPLTNAITKVYDSTTAVPNFSPTAVTVSNLVPGDQLQGGLSVTSVSYSDKNVGNAIPLLAQLSGTPSFVDSLGNPVYGYALTNALTGNITPRPLSLTGVAVGNKVYDGSPVASITGGALVGLAGGETLNFQPGTAQFATADAGVGKPVSAQVVLTDGSGRASNYQLTGGVNIATTANITPRPVSVSQLVVTPKVYDGNTAAQVSGGAVTGLVAGETLTVVTGPGQFDTKDVGSAKTVTASVTLSDGSGKVGNYTLSSTQASGIGSITPRQVTVSGISADNKVYDGSTLASLKGGVFTGLVGDETLTLGRTGVFDTQDAGIGKTVVATLSLADGANGGKASNYQLAGSGQVNTSADITPKPLSISGLSALTREYDGTRDVTLAGTGSLAGLVGNEQLGFSLGSGQYDSKDAGVDKTITASLLLSDGANGGKASNYALVAAGSTTFTGTILPKALSISGVSAADKVYDGSRAASITLASVQGFVAGETLRVEPLGQFADKNVGAGKSVSVALSLQDGEGGGLAANYSLADSVVATTASIERRPVTVNGVVALDKIYDGTRVAQLGGGSFSGLVAGESLRIGGTAQFNDKNVGTGKAVTGSIALADGAGGGLASNYALTGSSAFSGSASIQPRTVNLAAATAADKVYDSSTTASVGNFVLAGVLPGEQVTVAAGNGRFADPNVGVGKPVTATATALGGPDAGNYAFGSASVLTRASISPATLTYFASPAVRPVGQTPGDLQGSVNGFVGADSLSSATAGALSFDTTASAATPAGRYPVFGQGLVAANYVFRQDPANATALALLDVPQGLTGDVGSQTQAGNNQVLAMLPLPLVSSPGSHRVADVLPALATGSGSGSGSGSGAAFASLDLAKMSLADTATLLAARDQYKRAIFAEALAELERDPSLADVPACQTVEQAAAGNCLITEVLKPALRARILQQQPMAAPAVAAATQAPAGAPANAPATAPASLTPATAPTPAAPPVALARPAPLPAEPRIELPARRAVRSAALPQIERKLALVIGIDHYADGRIPKLDHAVSDATTVGEVLEKALGYQTLVVRDGSKRAILSAFNQLAAQVSPSDSVVIYYAGHGELLEKSGLGYWQPADADAARPESWISNADIGKLLAQLSASQVALISDSCFSGSLVSDERIRGIPSSGDPAALLSRRAAVVMTSGGNEPVFDSGKNGHSTFAWNLMRTMEQVSTWKPGSAVFEQVRFAVARELPQRPQYGASRLGGHQTGTDYLFEQRQLDGAVR